MKKIFLFAAAAVAAMTVNAASFVGFDGRGGDLGAQIAGGLFKNQVNVTLAETSTGKYSVRNTAEGELSFTAGGIKFVGSDAVAAKDIYKTYNTYIQPNGARRSMTIPTVAGEKVQIFVQDALEGVAVEGAAEGDKVNFVAWGDNKDLFTVLTAKGSQIVIWSDDRADSPAQKKWKLGAVLPDGGTGIEGVNAESVKAVKRVVDGQVVIERDGRLFNLLGAEIAR
ncbi:MAG: hypothetical protein IKQ50_02810 [Paludibacteraceae bacterium]|nr:hypothetical protein [Paludibacteraceae bacterium]MBR6167342.1 hypothetical protein [Paludibacteraceae bacterium]